MARGGTLLHVLLIYRMTHFGVASKSLGDPWRLSSSDPPQSSNTLCVIALFFVLARRADDLNLYLRQQRRHGSQRRQHRSENRHHPTDRHTRGERYL